MRLKRPQHKNLSHDSREFILFFSFLQCVLAQKLVSDPGGVPAKITSFLTVLSKKKRRSEEEEEEEEEGQTPRNYFHTSCEEYRF